jgi:hypothetical protein
VSLTSQQEDNITDILYNIPPSEFKRVLVDLSAEELLTLRSQAEKFIRRQRWLIEAVDNRLEDIGRTS